MDAWKSAEYLLNTVARCEELGVHDPYLWRMQALVAERMSADPLKKLLPRALGYLRSASASEKKAAAIDRDVVAGT